MQSFANPEMLAVSHGFALVVSPEENSHFRIIIPRLSNQGEQSSFGAGVSTASCGTLRWLPQVCAMKGIPTDIPSPIDES